MKTTQMNATQVNTPKKKLFTTVQTVLNHQQQNVDFSLLVEVK
jgi:hypothetical protein